MQQDKGNIYNNSNLSITIPNGATIWFKGGDKPDSLYGEDVYGAVIDEASRCKEEVWSAVRSTITARSEEHTSELQSQSTISYAVFCLKKKTKKKTKQKQHSKIA